MAKIRIDMPNDHFNRFTKADLRDAAIAVGLAILQSVPLLAADLLTWAPPALTHPVTVKISNGKSYYGWVSQYVGYVLKVG